MNRQPFTLEPLPRKVEILSSGEIRQHGNELMPLLSISPTSPFHHENPTTIRRLRGRTKERYRYRIGDIRFIYRVDRDKQLIRIVQIDNRGDIY